MTDHLPDAQVTTERLDVLIYTIETWDVGMGIPPEFMEAGKALRELKALRERCEQLRSDVAELLSLDDSITHRLEMPHGWTDDAIAAHRRDLDDRQLLKYSLRVQCSPSSAGDGAT